MTYKIEFKTSVKKDLKNIDKSNIKLILREIEKLQKGIEGNKNIKKLSGSNPYYRLRIKNYRVVFEKNDDVLIIIVIKVGHRKDIYKKI